MGVSCEVMREPSMMHLGIASTMDSQKRGLILHA